MCESYRRDSDVYFGERQRQRYALHCINSFINNFFNMIQNRRTRPILTALGEENKLVEIPGVRVTLEQMTEKLSKKNAFHIGKRKVQVNRIKAGEVLLSRCNYVKLLETKSHDALTSSMDRSVSLCFPMRQDRLDDTTRQLI